MTKKEHLRKKYQAVLLDWMGSGFEVPVYDTLEEAVEDAKKILTEESPYCHLYSSILISKVKNVSGHLHEEHEVLIVEKQPETWKIVEIKPEEFEKKSLFRYSLEMYKDEIERQKDPEGYKKKEAERIKKTFAKAESQ